MKVRYRTKDGLGEVVDVPTHAAEADVQFGFAEFVPDEKPDTPEETPVLEVTKTANETADDVPNNPDPIPDDSGSVQEGGKGRRNRNRR